VVAVVPAGGTGMRMGARVPKQFLTMGRTPILVHTLRALTAAKEVEGLVVAVPHDRVTGTRALLDRHRIRRVLAVVAGGADRQESVWLALQALPPTARWVLVHDAVRPFLPSAVISAVLAAARSAGAAVCGLAVTETVKKVADGLVEATLDRAGLWLVQTPQGFGRELLCQAHRAARRDRFHGTDDAVLIERMGGRVAMVPGSARNIKITTPADLAVARTWMARRPC
jgi:2-C-methyl-D-erythritol 4-phosphate cytidylyltransferase